MKNLVQSHWSRVGALHVIFTAAVVFAATQWVGHTQTIGERGYLLVTSWNNHSVLRYDAATGAFVDAFVAKRSGGLVQPWGCIFSPYDGSLLVTGNHFVQSQFVGVLRYDGVTGEFIEEFTEKVFEPHGITFGPDGNVYVGMRTAPGVGVVARFDGLTGEYLGDFVAPLSGGLVHPVAHLFGPAGRNPHRFDLYVATGNLGKVLRFDGSTGALIGDFVAAGSGGLTEPYGMVFGPDGHLYVADSSESFPAILRFQGPNGASPGAFTDVFIPPGSGGLLQTFGLLFGPDANSDGYQDLYVNSQVIHPKSFQTVNGTSSVKLYDGMTGEYIRDFIPVESNGGLKGPSLMTFTLTDPVTLQYLGD